MRDLPTTALGWADSFRSGDLTPIDALEHCLARIEELDEKLGAFVRLTPDRAREAAAAATRRIASGQALSRLDGVPTAIKDLSATEGVETTFGSAAMRGHVPGFSDEVVRRIEAAGMVSIGKTNTPSSARPATPSPT